MRPDRDDPLGPVIRETLQASRTDCPDAETIAAYAERALASGERRGVQLHLSNCSRCRETLLLMEKGTAAVFQETKNGGSPLFRWPWLAAVAAAGLATVIWLKLPPSAPQRSDSNQVLPEQAAANSKAPAEADAAAKKTVSAARPAPPPPAREAFGDRAKLGDERRDEERKSEETAERRRPSEKPVAAPGAPPPPAAAPARPQVSTPAPASPAESVATDAASPGLMARQNREYVIAGGPKRRAGIAATGPAITWRVWASGIVERSADGGATWTREAGVDALGARAALAPSADVCWIVGEAGLILRLESGRGWTRVTPPVPVAFVAIDASDARNATITAVDGRRFTTTDGGQTWH